MKRQFRLTKSSDIQRVRQFGKSYAHPLIVLIALALPGDQLSSQFAVVAGRGVGGAVQRNRAKRLLRESLRPLLPRIVAGWQVVLLCRRPMAETTFANVRDALQILLERACLLRELHEPGAA